MKHQRPKGKATGHETNTLWEWQKARWIKCHCGFWHSNRFIPHEFWNQNWKLPNENNRKKVGIILIKDKSHIWITQSYHNCYGFPKGEKEQSETIEQCAKREFFEETGYNIDKVNLSNCFSIRTNMENIQYIFYVISVSENFEMNTFPIDDVEITSFGWVHIDNIASLKLSKAVRKIFEIFKRNFWIIRKI